MFVSGRSLLSTPKRLAEQPQGRGFLSDHINLLSNTSSHLQILLTASPYSLLYTDVQVAQKFFLTIIAPSNYVYLRIIFIVAINAAMSCQSLRSLAALSVHRFVRSRQNLITAANTRIKVKQRKLCSVPSHPPRCGAGTERERLQGHRVRHVDPRPVHLVFGSSTFGSFGVSYRCHPHGFLVFA